MRLMIFNACGLILALSLLLAQGPAVKTSRTCDYAFCGEWGPALVPTSATSLCIAQQGDSCTSTKTFWLTKITLANKSGTADTCFVEDQQGTPIGLFGVAATPMTFPGSSTTMLVSRGGEKMVGGLKWGCTNGTVSARVEYGY